MRRGESSSIDSSTDGSAATPDSSSTEGCSEPVAVAADPPQAADFLLTIIGLAARRCALDDQGEGGSHV
jgi:hypothetical protein